jgi:hypothetical protein
MKSILILLSLVIILFSCSKSSNTNGNASYAGEYHTQVGDTATVSVVSNQLLKIRFAAKNTSALRCTFDSIKINQDGTFTCNEFTVRENPGLNFGPEPAVGAGAFGTNTLAFQISISGGSQINFTGVK